MKKMLIMFLVIIFLFIDTNLFADKIEIVLWHAYRGKEKAALEKVRDNFNKTHSNIQVKFLQVPFDALADKITAAVPRGKGPDLFIFAQDRIGDWVEKGILEPIGIWVNEEMRKQFMPIALNALTYEDALYGLPTALKCLALIYNKKFIKKPPETTDELIELAKKFTVPSKNQFGLVYENGLTYYNACWFYGFGGGIFDKNVNPIIDSPGNVKALKFIYALLRKYKVMPEEITSSLVTTLFNTNKAAMVLSGPWFLAEIQDNIDYGVALLPVIKETNQRAKPFLTVEGIMMSALSKHKKEAFEVMKFFTSKDSAIIMATEGRQPVANLLAYKDPRVANDPYIPVFKKQAEMSVPMPNFPEMRMVWTPFDIAIGKVLNNSATPEEALKEANEKVKKDIELYRQ